MGHDHAHGDHEHDGHSHDGHSHDGHSHEGHDHSHGGHSHEGHDHAHEGHSHGGGGHSHSAGPASFGLNLVGPSADEIAECPVMRGSTVVKAEAEAKGLFRDYEGQRYWFCCAACEDPFDADPAKYAAAV